MLVHSSVVAAGASGAAIATAAAVIVQMRASHALAYLAVSKATGRVKHYLLYRHVVCLNMILMPAGRAGVSKA